VPSKFIEGLNICPHVRSAPDRAKIK